MHLIQSLQSETSIKIIPQLCKNSHPSKPNYDKGTSWPITTISLKTPCLAMALALERTCLKETDVCLTGSWIKPPWFAPLSKHGRKEKRINSHELNYDGNCIISALRTCFAVVLASLFTLLSPKLMLEIDRYFPLTNHGLPPHPQAFILAINSASWQVLALTGPGVNT